MRKFRRFFQSILIIFSVIFASSFFALAQDSNYKSYKFINGRWFDGKAFKSQTFYSSNGVLTKKKPSQAAETIDLRGGFVIPPFGEAHTHNLDGTRDLARFSKTYLDEGTFYVQVLGNYATGAKAARPFLNKPSTLDVVYANGMLTSTYGHPFMVYEPLAMGIYNPNEAFRRIDEVKKSRLAENNAYWFLDTKADVDAKWGKILASKPDLIKISLIDAKNFDKYKNTADAVNKGLSPEVAAYVVEKVHQSGLRVFAHIETAEDFRIGVKIGVDVFAHAPYYSWDGKIETQPRDDLTAKDLKLTAAKRVVVIPTAQRGTYSATEYTSDGKSNLNAERLSRIVERHRKLFNLMLKNGVKIALGLDNFGSTVSPEIWYFHDNKIFDDRTLLKIVCETTPQTIFPNRKIGQLRDGYEANFLVLEGNPLEDFNQIKKIRMRFKQGSFIETGK